MVRNIVFEFAQRLAHFVWQIDPLEASLDELVRKSPRDGEAVKHVPGVAVSDVSARARLKVGAAEFLVREKSEESGRRECIERIGIAARKHVVVADEDGVPLSKESRSANERGRRVCLVHADWNRARSVVGLEVDGYEDEVELAH